MAGTKAYEFAKDQNQVTLHGHRYVAKDLGTVGSCRGCSFRMKFGCKLAECIYSIEPVPFMGATLCQSSNRNDKRNIIWVLP